MSVEAVVFDFDGTILDTELPTYQAWADVYRRHGCELTLAEWSVCVGTRGGFDPYAALAARAAGPVPPRDEIRTSTRARVRHLLADAPLRPGVLAWLDEAAARHHAVGIASSSRVERLEHHLVRLGVRDRFACLSCYDGTAPSKPDPASYRAACASLGVDPRAAIAVEDSPNGIAAARAAGLFCVAAPNPVTAGLDLSAADLVVDSLADVSLADVISASARRPGGTLKPAPDL